MLWGFWAKKSRQVLLTASFFNYFFAASLVSWRSRARMSTTQGYTHSTLSIHLSCSVPIYFVGADYAVAAAGQLIIDAAILIGVISDSENHPCFQDEHWNTAR